MSCKQLSCSLAQTAILLFRIADLCLQVGYHSVRLYERLLRIKNVMAHTYLIATASTISMYTIRRGCASPMDKGGLPSQCGIRAKVPNSELACEHLNSGSTMLVSLRHRPRWLPCPLDHLGWYELQCPKLVSTTGNGGGERAQCIEPVRASDHVPACPQEPARVHTHRVKIIGL